MPESSDGWRCPECDCRDILFDVVTTVRTQDGDLWVHPPDIGAGRVELAACTQCEWEQEFEDEHAPTLETFSPETLEKENQQ